MPWTVVLETFQTYHAHSSAVNPSCHRGNRERRALDAILRSERARYRSGQPSAQQFRRTKAPERSNSLKELLLEVLRLPLTCQRTLSPTSSPVAGAATTKLLILDAGFFCGIQNRVRIRSRQKCLSLTLPLYQTCSEVGNWRVAVIGDPALKEPPNRINTGDYPPLKWTQDSAIGIGLGRERRLPT